ncbi:class I SAM-dependent rRNA methyltransferase [Listeria grandensis]|uniref:Class I SAM-dependent rRNA methyltransferase n=1 Tax=Listeria grandensis TaxID=1494963 RepID=A0A7X0Y4F1_9LIST|nr:class I SAM-dependent rRNA methyltransferase [Listeria grandensis]MBC1936825.1 class I SAM-dependent rRNA methyltransferase [Listeria grandensis]
MMQEITIKIKKKSARQYIQGYPLLTKEAVVAWPDMAEGTVLRLTDEANRFIAKAYHGNQNKGIGWLLTYDAEQALDQAFFVTLFKEAFAKRQAFFHDEATTAFRIFNGEGDGLGGLTVDYYDGFLVLQWYSNGIYKWKQMLVAALKRAIDTRGIYEKRRFDEKGQYLESDDFLEGETAPEPLIVKENGINYAVYLNDGAMTGIFLDQRDVRKTICDTYAAGRTVLNTFSYTGAFSIAAAFGGAAHTTNVDVANRSIPKTHEQFSVNELDPTAHTIMAEDVFQYFKYANRKALAFDMVILDPPSFARTKKTTFSVAKDYGKLLEESIAITNPNGIIVASTNYAGYGMEKFKQVVQKAFQHQGRKYRIVEQFTLPADFATRSSFKEGNYLKVLFLEVE